ncbi:RrF2 family transcriptional regulator [Frigoriglobus tundricola]|nr:Rrf2 family transcriptional regulator [Frigoriglobus tundricola]
MFSQTVEYALRAVIHLANEAPAARTTAQIADATRVPKDYLSKILQGLAKKGIVDTQRGVGGGISLAKPPTELTILDVVNAVEPIKRFLVCPLDLPNHGTNLCPLHKRMDDAMATVEAAFRNTTLAEVLADPSNTSVPLCDGSGAVQSLKMRGK